MLLPVVSVNDRAWELGDNPTVQASESKER